MLIKMMLRNETYKKLEKFCKEQNIEINEFVEKTILEKIEIELIKKSIKSKNQFEITDNDSLYDNNYLMEDYYTDKKDKIKH